jgi:hypothetical protein
MGASLWSYIVEYQESVENAFRSLQEELLRQEGGGTLEEYVEAATPNLELGVDVFQDDVTSVGTTFFGAGGLCRLLITHAS